jgi:hypothetical protein
MSIVSSGKLVVQHNELTFWPPLLKCALHVCVLSSTYKPMYMHHKVMVMVKEIIRSTCTDRHRCVYMTTGIRFYIQNTQQCSASYTTLLLNRG